MSQKKPRRRWLIGCVAGSGIGLALLTLAILVISVDEPPPEDGDLLPPARVEIPVASNGFVLLEQAWQGWTPPTDLEEVCESLKDADLESRRLPPDGDRARTILADAKARLTLVTRAAESPDYQSPEVEFFAERLPYAKFMQLWRLLEVRAHVRFLDGDDAGAFADLKLQIDLGRRVCARSQTLLEYVIGAVLVRDGTASIREFLPHTTLTTEALGEVERSLRRHSFDPREIAMVFRGEYAGLRTMWLDRDLSADLDYPTMARFGFKPNRTLRKVGDQYRLVLDQIDSGAFDSGTARQLLPPASWGEQIWALASGNWVGEQMLRGLVPALGDIAARGYMMAADLHATRVLIALRCHRGVDGRPRPATLSELVPEFLPELPRDPFGDRLIRYNRDRTAVYFFGQDDADGGGLGSPAELNEPTYPIGLTSR